MEKNKIICDTDVLIDYFEMGKVRHLKTKEIIDNKIGMDNVTLSIISKMELTIGAFNKSELRVFNKNIHGLNILLINPSISSIASELLEEYNLSHGLAIPDAFIAATAIYTELQFFTYNLKDFKFIKEIKLYNL